MLSDTSFRYLGTLQDNNRHQQTPTDTNRHQTTPTDVAKHPKRLFKDVWQFMLTSIFVCWCLMTSFTVLCCLQMSEGCLRSFSRGIWVLFIDLFKVWMRIRVYGSAQALYCVANALYWKSFKRQIFTHLTVLKHQNTKTSLNELSKNHWVIALFEIFGSVRKKLQFTVFNDHPVPCKNTLPLLPQIFQKVRKSGQISIPQQN